MLTLDQLGMIADRQTATLLAMRHRGCTEPNAELALRLLIMLLKRRLEECNEPEEIRSKVEAAITALESAQEEMLALHRQDMISQPEITWRILSVKHTIHSALDLLHQCEDVPDVSLAL